MKSFEAFNQLHNNASPLLIGNIWDVRSAKMFEANDFKAIGTSSDALAKTFGYEDGESLPFDTIVQLAKRVVEVVNIPFSVDTEGGYSRTTAGIIENIKKLHDVGVVGINLEDTVPGDTRQLQPVAAFQKILSGIADSLSQQNIKMFLNIRTDGFILGMPTALDETLIRIKSYESTGACGIFVPCITKTEDIMKVVNATKLPVNVMCMPELPNFEELKKIGVKRISIGTFFNNYLDRKAEAAINTVVKENNFSALFK